MSGARIKAAFFDVDGVLLDSLPQHLAICRDKAREYGLAIKVPDLNAFRSMVAAGMKVSPMLEFFRVVGFPEAFAERAVADYEREFMQRYRPEPFAGVEAMLARLASAGWRLGLVTANTRANVVPALGASMAHFDASALYFFDSAPKPFSKAHCLAKGARHWRLVPSDCTFVGDQLSDLRAATAAGCRFLGASYGWGLPEDPSLVVADSIPAIADALERLTR